MTSRTPPQPFDQIKRQLHQAGITFSEESGGRLAIEDGPEDYLIELDPVKGVLCLFGVDMGELRLLVSGSGNEDLGEDELQRVAREHLRPMVRRYQPLFSREGFEEQIEVDAGSYAVAFAKPVDALNPDAVVDMIRWCRRAARPDGS